MNAVRLAVTAPESSAELEQGLKVLKELLESDGDYAFVD